MRKTDAWVLRKQESGGWAGGDRQAQGHVGSILDSEGKGERTDQGAALKKAGLRASKNVQKSSLVCKNLWDLAR